jgi:hypothetical protein
MYEFHSFIKFGDASEELKKLYSEGWRLVTVITPFAVSVPENQTDNHFFAYAVEFIGYFYNSRIFQKDTVVFN